MKAEAKAPRVITLGGREWRVIQACITDLDWYMDEKGRAASIAPEKFSNETDEQFAHRLLDQIMSGGHAWALLGGLLLPPDVDDANWTREQAAETSEFMRKLTDPDDKQAVLMLIVNLLIAFFGAARSSSKPSRTASDRRTRAEAARDPEPEPAAAAL